MSINEAALAAARETSKQLVLIQEGGYSPPELQVAFNSNVQTIGAIQAIPDPPPPVKNAQFYGAKGDGITDDTAAIQAMADTGVLIFDVPGVYMIDAVKRIEIRNNGSTMKCLPEAGAITFRCIPNAAAKYRMFNTNATDCVFDLGGAYLVGDRASHVWAPQSTKALGTHEWGYCFFLGGARNKLFGNGKAMMTGATGDGLGITGPDHVVYGIILDRNRRNAWSGFNAPRLKFHDNVCSNTGNGGIDPAPTALIGPFCGGDIEPDQGDCKDVEIYNNTFGPGNRSGFIAWRNSRAGTGIISGKFYGNTVIGNSNGNWFCDEVAGRYNIIFSVERNRYVNNKATDVKCDQGTVISIGNADKANANTFDDFNDYPDGYKQGFVSAGGAMQALRGAKVNAGWNYVV